MASYLKGILVFLIIKTQKEEVEDPEYLSVCGSLPSTYPTNLLACQALVWSSSKFNYVPDS